MWYFLAFNTPSEHPRISPEELEYIELNVSADVKCNHKLKVPWKYVIFMTMMITKKLTDLNSILGQFSHHFRLGRLVLQHSVEFGCITHL